MNGMKTICPICKGSGKLPVTQQPKAESHGEETIGECPTCHGKGEVDNEEFTEAEER
jgi:DnaJ-class molecular chaperone